MNKKVQVTKDNVKEFMQMAQELAIKGTKKGVAIKKMQEHFGCSAAVAKKVIEGDQEVLKLREEYEAENGSGEGNVTEVEVNTPVETPTEEAVTAVEEAPKRETLTKVGDKEFFINDDPQVMTGEILMTTKIGRQTKQVLVQEKIDGPIMRTLVDWFYQTQSRRIAQENQLRAVEQDRDTSFSESSVLKWMVQNTKIEEAGIAEIMNAVTERDPLCSWMREIHGIGPTFASVLRGYLDVTKAHYATNFISWAGLNDRNTPWIGKDQIGSILDEVWDTCENTKKGDISTEFMIRLAIRTGRTYTKVLKAATTKWDAKNKVTIDLNAPSIDALKRNMCKVPYNKNLKVLMFKIADRWNKMPNDKRSLYTQLMLTRKAIETERNERGEYAAYAAKMLATKKFTKQHVIDTLKEGMLPKQQIQYRAYRIACKVFLSHVFEAMYIYQYGKYPARFYTLDILGHQDEIFPEVPYDQLFDAYGERTGLVPNRTRKAPVIDPNADNLRNRLEKAVEREYSVDAYLNDIAYWNKAQADLYEKIDDVQNEVPFGADPRSFGIELPDDMKNLEAELKRNHPRF